MASVDQIMRYENGEMDDEEEIIAFFQDLIDSGLAWSLQGSYGRTAKTLIAMGHCHKKERQHNLQPQTGDRWETHTIYPES